MENQAASTGSEAQPVVMQIGGQNGQQVIQTVNGQQVILQGLGGQTGQIQLATGSAGGQTVQIIPLQNLQQAASSAPQQVVVQQSPQIIQTQDGQTVLFQPVQMEAAQPAAASSAAAPAQPQAISVNNGQILMLVPGGGGGGAQLQRIPLPGPELLEEEPLYVNAKQYHRILKRRQARARLETDGRVPKERRKYLHESRHKHALNRARGDGGRFGSGPAKKVVSEVETRPANTATTTASSAPVTAAGPPLKYELR